MTPPKVDKVNIQALDALYLENLQGVDVNEAAKRFKGTDLMVDTKTGELKKTGKDAGGVDVTSLEQEAAWVKLIREANLANKDGKKDEYLDLDEVKKLLTGLPADQSATIDPQKFLESIDKLMKERYNPLSGNMKGWKAELAFRPTLDALDLYSKGLLSEGYRHANATFAMNGLTKTGVNIAGFIPLGVRRLFTDKYVLWGDKLAMDSAKKDYETRTAVIGKLKEVIEKGVAANEPWAVSGNMEEALKKLDAKDAALLRDQLAAVKLHDIINTQDDKERNTKMMAFAKEERPGFLGFGTGNTSEGWFNNGWNYSGHRYNLMFARTMFRYLSTKASSGDATTDDAMHKDARLILSDMNGNGGGFNNLVSVGGTGLLCGLKKGITFGQADISNGCITEYRDWADEDVMDGLGRGIDGAIMVFGGNRFLTRFGEAGKLARYKGVFTAEGVLGTWKGAMAESKWNILAGGKWGEYALAAEKEAETLGLAGKSAKDGRLWRLLDKWDGAKTRFKDWVFKGVPLSPEQKAFAEKAAKAGGKGMDKLTKGVVLIGIMQYADQKVSPHYNPFDYGLKDMNREAEFERYNDPTQPDPTLSAPKKK